MVAARTSRIMLGTGILVLPIREPAILAKTAATIQSGSHGRLMLGVAAGWYEREFHATAVPFGQRGRIFERNLDMLYRLWTEDDVTGEWDGRVLQHVRMLPRPGAAAAGAHRRVRGPGAAPGGHPLGRLGDVLLRARVDRRGVVR